MQEIKNVRGSAVQAVPIIAGKDTVYIHTNIHTVEVTDPNGTTHTEYEYNEIQYSKDEFLAYMYNQLLLVQQYATGIHVDVLSGSTGGAHNGI